MLSDKSYLLDNESGLGTVSSSLLDKIKFHAFVGYIFRTLIKRGLGVRMFIYCAKMLLLGDF